MKHPTFQPCVGSYRLCQRKTGVYKTLPTRLLAKRQAAFSLVELLLVVVIIAIVAALATAGLSGIQRSLALSTASSQVVDYLAIGRQTAMTLNQPVEIWFCQGSTTDSLLLYRRVDGTAVAIEKELRLNERVALSPNELWSSLLTDDISGPNLPAPLPGRTGRVFRFMPDGATDLAGSNSPTVTLLNRTDIESQSLPANFVALQIDQQIGTLRVLRPQ